MYDNSLGSSLNPWCRGDILPWARAFFGGWGAADNGLLRSSSTGEVLVEAGD